MGKFTLNFNYNQFLIYDISTDNPICEWEHEHTSQSFARREGCVCVATLIDNGIAETQVFLGFDKCNNSYTRLIAVPLNTVTGKVVIREILSLYYGHVVFCKSGFYLVYIGQDFINIDEDLLRVDIFFEECGPLESSRVLIADTNLTPSQPLVETANPLE